MAEEKKENLGRFLFHKIIDVWNHDHDIHTIIVVKTTFPALAPLFSGAIRDLKDYRELLIIMTERWWKLLHDWR